MSSSWLERQNSNKKSSVKVGNDLEAPDATQPLDVSDYVLGRVEVRSTGRVESCKRWGTGPVSK